MSIQTVKRALKALKYIRKTGWNALQSYTVVAKAVSKSVLLVRQRATCVPFQRHLTREPCTSPNVRDTSRCVNSIDQAQVVHVQIHRCTSELCEADSLHEHDSLRKVLPSLAESRVVYPRTKRRHKSISLILSLIDSHFHSDK